VPDCIDGPGSDSVERKVFDAGCDIAFVAGCVCLRGGAMKV
jgi:hypothetical protein